MDKSNSKNITNYIKDGLTSQPLLNTKSSNQSTTFQVTVVGLHTPMTPTLPYYMFPSSLQHMPPPPFTSQVMSPYIPFNPPFCNNVFTPVEYQPPPSAHNYSNYFIPPRMALDNRLINPESNLDRLSLVKEGFGPTDNHLNDKVFPQNASAKRSHDLNHSYDSYKNNENFRKDKMPNNIEKQYTTDRCNISHKRHNQQEFNHYEGKCNDRRKIRYPDHEKRFMLMSKLDALDNGPDDELVREIQIKHTLPRIPNRYRRDFLETISKKEGYDYNLVETKPCVSEDYTINDFSTCNESQENLDVLSTNHQKTNMDEDKLHDTSPPSSINLTVLKNISFCPYVKSPLQKGSKVVHQLQSRRAKSVNKPPLEAFLSPIISNNLIFPNITQKRLKDATLNNNHELSQVNNYPWDGCSAPQDDSLSLIAREEQPVYTSSDEEFDANINNLGETDEPPVIEASLKLHNSQENIMDDSEIFDMLEQPVDKASAPLIYKKSVMRAIDKDDFEVLPDNWIEVTHNSGIPIYLHRGTRVCTLSRPYFLGLASVRKHGIPLGSVPCLNYKKYKERMAKDNPGRDLDIDRNLHILQKDTKTVEGILSKDESQSAAAAIAPFLVCPEKFKVTVESAEDVKNRHWLTPAQLREYCEKVFDFHTITVRKFKTWADRRKQIRKIKSNRPSLPKSAQIVKCLLPVQRLNGQIVAKKKNFFFNPEDKSILCVLHEYVQNVLKTQVQYTFCTVENTKLPFCSKLNIKGVEYGVGYGSNKKAAKLEAARVALSILNPEIAEVYNKASEIDNENMQANKTHQDNSFTTCVKLFPQESLPSIGYTAHKLIKESAKTIGNPTVETKNDLSLEIRQETLPCNTKIYEKEEILSPYLKFDGNYDSLTPKLVESENFEKTINFTSNDEQLDLFNELKITDPRITELSIKAGQPLPYALLLECIKRNFGLTDSNVQSELKTIKPSRHNFTLTVGKHMATVLCSNKREGKHKAAQQVLQNIHPQVANWGSILRLYGRNYTKDLLGRKMEQNSITSLQTQSKLEGPNINILNKLKVEMDKLYERRLLLQPAAMTSNLNLMKRTDFHKITDLNI